MNILVALTYYRPHTSGLTIYAERLARSLAERGHQVTILTSRYSKQLPKNETMDGVRVVRAPVVLRISKGVVMPTFGFIANHLVAKADAINLHLPQLDAAGLAIRGRLLKKPTITTYHCDLRMPVGMLSWLANQGVHFMDRLAIKFSHRVVAYTHDYAENSLLIQQYINKLKVINPPVIIPAIEKSNVREFRKLYNPRDQYPVIGMAARFAAEKGVEVLLASLDKVVQRYPNALVWFAGPYKNIIGEENYFRRLEPLINEFIRKGHWKFLDVLTPAEMASFYSNIDTLIVPSLNSTEAFGLVQIEAMMHKVPVVASDLPGVRQPVKRHGTGMIVPVGDSEALANAIVEVISQKEKYDFDVEEIRRVYNPEAVASAYEDLFEEIQKELK